MSDNDLKHIKHAIKLAYEHIGYTKYNPLVGAVITYKDEVVGTGGHHQPKTQHAEVIALNNMKNHPKYKVWSENRVEWQRNTTIYVTLEPCGHHGSNPPCSHAIVANNIGRVVYTTADPNPVTCNKGPDYLKANGVKVIGPLNIPEADEITHDFRRSILTKKSYLAIKVATSIDGCMATQNFDSKWISNTKSRGFAHYLRQRYDAICVGVNTVLQDDPQLTVRKDVFDKFTCEQCHKYTLRQPIAILIDPNQKILLPENQNLSILHQTNRRVILVSSGKPVKPMPPHFEHLVAKTNDRNELNWDYIRTELYCMAIGSIFVEGGSRTISTIINQRSFDRLYIVYAPLILGGNAISFTSAVQSPEFVRDALNLDFIEINQLDEDVLVTYERKL